MLNFEPARIRTTGLDNSPVELKQNSAISLPATQAKNLVADTNSGVDRFVVALKEPVGVYSQATTLNTNLINANSVHTFEAADSIGWISETEIFTGRIHVAIQIQLSRTGVAKFIT